MFVKEIVAVGSKGAFVLGDALLDFRYIYTTLLRNGEKDSDDLFQLKVFSLFLSVFRDGHILAQLKCQSSSLQRALCQLQKKLVKRKNPRKSGGLALND